MKNYILKISLNETEIWRRISLPQGLNFLKLHEVIQIIFGWENRHLHEFNVIGMRIIIDEGRKIYKYVEMIKSKYKFESELNLDLILLNEKSFKYYYDFGDSWELKIEVEETEVEGKPYPVLIEYGGTMAMEDCGGVDGLKDQGGKPVNINAINKILKATFEG